MQPSQATPTPTPSPDSGIAPMIQRSMAAFRRDLPQLLQSMKRFRQWVAYHGDEQIGFASTDTELYEECYRRGLRDEEFVVCFVIPEMTEVEESWAFWNG